jgi:hypothetical protein
MQFFRGILTVTKREGFGSEEAQITLQATKNVEQHKNNTKFEINMQNL